MLIQVCIYVPIRILSTMCVTGFLAKYLDYGATVLVFYDFIWMPYNESFGIFLLKIKG